MCCRRVVCRPPKRRADRRSPALTRESVERPLTTPVEPRPPPAARAWEYAHSPADDATAYRKMNIFACVNLFELKTFLVMIV